MRPVCSRLPIGQAVEKLGIKPIDRDRKTVKKARAALTAAVGAWLARQGPRIAEQVIEALGLEKSRRRAGGNAAAIAEAGLRARALSALLEFDQLDKLVAVVEEQLAMIGLDGAMLGVAQVGGSVEAALLAEHTLPFAQARAAELVGMKRNALGQLVPNPDAKWRIDDATRDMVQGKVSEALTEGWSADELKKQLLDGPAFSESRAETIARTELARADMAGTMTGYRDSGLVAGKTWSTSQDDVVSDECRACEAAGVIGLNETFPSGEDAPPNHPNCRCSVLPVLNDEMPASKAEKGNTMPATTTGADRDSIRIGFPISKTEKTEDGRLLVEGIATSEALDLDGEVIDYESAKAAFSTWAGNIREQHDPKKAVGKAIEVHCDDAAKQISVRAFISAGAQDTQAKIADGTLSGFSIGAKVAGRKPEPVAKADGTTVMAQRVALKRLTELSVVDVGANPDSGIALVKADGDDVFLASEGAADELQKGVYTAKTLLDALSLVRSCCADAEYDVKYGGHSEEVVAEMKGTLAAIGAIAQKYLGEEIAAMLNPNKTAAAEGGDLQKGGRRFSAATKAALKSAHAACKAADKALADLGYDDDEAEDEGEGKPEADDKAKADAAAELQKRAAEQQAAVEEVAKAAGLQLAEPTQDALTKAAITELLTLRKSHAELLASPAAPKGVTRASAVSKAADLGADDKEPAPVVKSDGAVDDVATLVKAAQARPIRLA